MDSYYKLRQLFYYKVRHGLVQIATGITKWDDYYKLRQYRGLFSKFYGIYNDNLVCNTDLQRVLKKKNEYKGKMNVTSVRFES